MSDEDMSYMPNTTGNTHCGMPMPSGWQTVTVKATAAPPAAGMYVGDVPWQYMPPPAPGFPPTYIQWTPPLTEDRVCELIRELLTSPELRDAIRAVLEEDARQIRENKAFQPTKQAGTCCACLTSGDDLEWIGHRLAHKTEECRRIAAEMEPAREHRG